MKLRWIIVVVSSIAAIAAIAYFHESTIFTCTTFFDYEKQDKWEVFCKAMDSIREKHDPATLQSISRWLVVNEYSATPKKDWAPLMRERYPFIEFIQKDKEHKGQANSMNIILTRIKPYRYWIHWEEAWYCRKPCIDRMFDIIRSTDVTQLQVTQLNKVPNWLDSSKHPRALMKTSGGIEYFVISPSPGTDEYLTKSVTEFNGDFFGHWPLYSLLPSMNRVNGYNIGTFSTDPKLWPIKFEWDFARRWLAANNKKAVLPDGPVIRDESKHRSTYSKV